MIKDFTQFITEVHGSKLRIFQDPIISNLFTTSIEIEMETESKEDSEIEYTEEEISEILSIIKKSVIKELGRLKDFKMTKTTQKFINDILKEVFSEYDDIDYIEEILNPRQFKDKIKKLIVKLIYPQVITYFFSDNLSYLTNKFNQELPNFSRKWSNQFKFEIDNTLDRGLEFSNKSYFSNIEELTDCIRDFYSDFNQQKFWIFNDKTGIHINIGLKNKSDFNIIKGILFLDDEGESPFVFKNMEWRQKSKFTKSIKDELTKLKPLLRKCFKKLHQNKIEEVETLLNDKLVKILYEKGYKNYGLNLLNIETQNYIEFRYPGGKVDEKTLIDKILYFSYIIYMMTNKELDKKEYQRKLYLFLTKNID